MLPTTEAVVHANIPWCLIILAFSIVLTCIVSYYCYKKGWAVRRRDEEYLQLKYGQFQEILAREPEPNLWSWFVNTAIEPYEECPDTSCRLCVSVGKYREGLSGEEVLATQVQIMTKTDAISHQTKSFLEDNKLTLQAYSRILADKTAVVFIKLIRE